MSRLGGHVSAASPLARFYRGLTKVETIAAYASFAGGTLALIADIFGREFLGNGIFGAQRFAVYCIAIAGMLGFSYVITNGGHLRPTVIDKLIPEGAQDRWTRAADVISFILCLLLSWASFIFVKSSFTIGERDMTLPVQTWTVQTVLIVAFVLSAIKYLIFALEPDLRPRDEGEGL